MPITRRQLTTLAPLALAPAWAHAQTTSALTADDALSWVRMDGQTWLVGELTVRAGATAMALESLSLSNAAGEGLLRLEGERLLAAAADAKGRPVRSLGIAAGEALGLFIWHALPASLGTPSAVRAECVLQAEGGVGRVPLSMALPVVAPTTLQPPLRGGPWVAVFDPGLPFGHRRAAFVRDGRRYIPARFAIDWIRLDAQGRPWAGEARKPFERWNGWGQEVLAVADGEIVAVRDGREDVMASDLPANRWTDDDVAGNYVGLAIPGGRFVFYEHLQRGSIVVAPGQRVKAGQAIGRVGRSGVNSSGPHLHFHVADAPLTLQAQGRPYAFTGFRALGGYGSMNDAQSGREWVERAAPAAKRQRELPSPNTVLMFDEPGVPTMYGLIGKMVAKPGQRDALIAILLENVGTMPGCRSYVVARDPGNEQAIWITEVWDNEASHKASLQLPGVKAAIQRAMPLIQGFEQHQVTEPVGGHGLGG